MGYFPNGTSGMVYEEMYCQHCVHHTRPDGSMRAVMEAHMIFNYDEYNNDKSILDILIPKSKETLAGDCTMFHPLDKNRCRKAADLFDTHLKETANAQSSC